MDGGHVHGEGSPRMNGERDERRGGDELRWENWMSRKGVHFDRALEVSGETKANIAGCGDKEVVNRVDYKVGDS